MALLYQEEIASVVVIKMVKLIISGDIGSLFEEEFSALIQPTQLRLPMAH